jgi:branched-chain amino acid transport system permease protein
VEIALHILSLAGIYGLFACGLTLVFGVMEVLNLAHATVFAFAAVFAMFLVGDAGLPVWLSCLTAILASTFLAVVVDRLAFRPLRYRGRTAWGRHFGPLLTSLGASTILLGLQRGWFGIDPRHFPPGIAEIQPWLVAGVRVNLVGITTFLVFVGVIAVLTLLLNRTRWGAEVRAVAERSETAALFGIDAERRFMETMALAGLMAGMAGVAWSFAFNIASPETGALLDVKGFALIILGGLGSVPGSLLGALAIASIEVLGGLWLPSGMQTLIVFAALIALLILRPQGLLGARIVEGAR